MTKSKNYATKNIRTRYSTLKKKKNRITFNEITLWNISYRSRNEQEIDRERERGEAAFFQLVSYGKQFRLAAPIDHGGYLLLNRHIIKFDYRETIVVSVPTLFLN